MSGQERDLEHGLGGGRSAGSHLEERKSEEACLQVDETAMAGPVEGRARARHASKPPVWGGGAAGKLLSCHTADRRCRSCSFSELLPPTDNRSPATGAPTALSSFPRKNESLKR